MSDHEKSLSEFKRQVDPSIFRDDLLATALHSYDATNEFFFPAAVVRPRSSDDIRKVVAAANRSRIPIIPRGAGTGFSGGSLPVRGGVILDLLGMNRLIDIDEESMTALVEPGVITLHLQDAVEKAGLFYPPDPASLKTCTIGGNVAENAGGPHCVKYGVTRDYVLSLEAVTGDGRDLSAGKGTLKNRAGYDIKDLLIGSEGTLAVFHKFLLRLVPRPEAQILFLAFFRDFEQATGLVNRLFRLGISPSSLEFMDEFAIRAVERHSGFGLPLDFQALLLIEIDGRHDEMPILRRKTMDCLTESAAEVRVAETRGEQEALWEIRRKTSPALRAFGNRKANEDIVVPRKHIPATIRALRELAGRTRLNIISFGHIGDGNIHVNIMYDDTVPGEPERVEKAIGEIFEIVNRFSGAVSGEHGIGIAKIRFLPKNLDRTGYELMRSLKRVFDPNNILNPHKMFY